MSQLVANCPRCKANSMTFDVLSYVPTKIEYGWKNYCEAFSLCRNCNKTTVFVLSQKEPQYEEAFLKKLVELKSWSVNYIADVNGHIGLKDMGSEIPPEHLPTNIDAAFREGATCLSVGCCNAATAMFRLCLDLATKELLPAEDVEGLKDHQRRNLSPRLGWLFDNGRLPETLRDLSACIKDHGNDGAHEGSVTEEEAEDILDFTRVLLERLYTEPKRIELARQRRDDRRNGKV